MTRKAKTLNRQKKVVGPEKSCCPLDSECRNCIHLKKCLSGKLSKVDGGFVMIPFWLINRYASKIPTSCWIILLYLYARAEWNEKNDNYGRCYPTLTHMEGVTGLCMNTLRTNLQIMVREGLINHTSKPIKSKGNVGPVQYKTRRYITLRWMTELKRLKDYVETE